MWSCQGTLQLVTLALHLRFAFGKASAAVTLVGRLKCLDKSFLHSSSFLHPLGLCPITRLQLHPPPFFPPPELAPYCPPPAVDLWSLYKNPPRLRPFFWLSLMPFWHTYQGPLITVSSIRFPILPSGTASFPGTAPVCRFPLSLSSSG